jgi:lipoprotein-releasing system permease protein
LRFELQIALRYLRARRKEALISITTLFTAVGVMLGVTALVITLAIMAGFESDLRQRVLGLTPQIEIQSYAGPLSNYREIQRSAGGVAGVTGSCPFIIAQAMLASSDGRSSALVRGVEPQNPVIQAQFGRFIRSGSLSNLAPAASDEIATGTASRPGELALGHELAERLKATRGSTVSLTAPIISGSKLTTKNGTFLVGAIFDSGVGFVDRNLVLMSLPLAQSFFGRDDKVDGIELRLASLDLTGRVTSRLRERLPHSLSVRTWIEFNQAASAGFAMLKLVYSIVLLLLIAVAAFNLVATLVMVVMEKRKDIAVLVAMGAKPSAIRLIFILKGVIVGAAGTLAGLILGAIGCFALSRYHFIHIPREIYGISSLPITASPFDFVVVAAASLLLCLVATVYPAHQAASQPPVEILRS